MIQCVSFVEQTRAIIKTIIQSDELHAKWLNTLSYLENCGARKIAACEHPTLVKEEMLKHASEEFRHAHHLKRQIEKVSGKLPTYSLDSLVGGVASLNYLKSLDVQTSRYLSEEIGLSKNQIKEASYLLVTFAIELRADELYRIYDEELHALRSKVMIRSILLEEKEHLNEMREGLELMPRGFDFAKVVCGIEGELCEKWLNAVLREIMI